jgi:hypothetical protein
VHSSSVNASIYGIQIVNGETTYYYFRRKAYFVGFTAMVTVEIIQKIFNSIYLSGTLSSGIINKSYAFEELSRFVI